METESLHEIFQFIFTFSCSFSYCRSFLHFVHVKEMTVRNEQPNISIINIIVIDFKFGKYDEFFDLAFHSDYEYKSLN